jgi:hypothetical protein
MSLEQALADNTAAVQALTKVLNGATVTQPAAGKAEGKKAAKEAKPAEPVKTESGTGQTSAGPSLKFVTDTVLDFAAENSAKAKEILKNFNVSRITELKAPQYPAVLEAVTKAKAAIAAELLSGNDDVDSLV